MSESSSSYNEGGVENARTSSCPPFGSRCPLFAARFNRIASGLRETIAELCERDETLVMSLLVVIKDMTFSPDRSKLIVPSKFCPYRLNDVRSMRNSLVVPNERQVRRRQ